MKFRAKIRAKAQITATEFLIVSVVLITIFIFATNLWNLVAIRFSEKSFRSSLELAALDISDFLLKSSGTPSSWEDNTSQIFSLGLASETHVLTQKKVSAFINFDYNSAKKILGIPNYEYKFIIRNLNGTIIYQSGLGPMPTAEVVAITRFVLFNNDITKMELRLWK